MNIVNLSNEMKKWKMWLNAVGTEIAELLREKNYYMELGKIIANNEKLHKYTCYFYAYLYRTFVSTAAIGIRRQDPDIDGCEKDKDDISIKKILVRMSKCSNEELKALNLNIDVDEIRADIGSLSRVVSKIRPLANKRIGHYEDVAIFIPTNQKIYDAIEEIYKLWKKYYVVFYPGSIGVELSQIDVRPGEFQYLFSDPWIK